MKRHLVFLLLFTFVCGRCLLANAQEVDSVGYAVDTHIPSHIVLSTEQKSKMRAKNVERE